MSKMRRKHYLPTMVHAITVITVLKMMANAQNTCNQGIGRIVYERLPDYQLQGLDETELRENSPPLTVMEKCQNLCLSDRAPTNNLLRACSSFDLQRGSRIASFSGGSEYEESTCYLTREQAMPEGIGNLLMVPNSVHFNEVCLSSSRVERECPNRLYVFERHPRKKLNLQPSDMKEVTALNRTDCEDRCLNEYSFVCRSATFDTALRTCYMSRFTRRTWPGLFKDDPNSDYLENTCLNAERRCDGIPVYIKDANTRLAGPFEVETFNNLTLEECQLRCIKSEKYYCRSVEYDEQTHQCIISEEDAVSQDDDVQISSSPTHHLYNFVCLDKAKGTEDNSVTSHLFSDHRKPDTAFQRFRNSRVAGEYHTEITGRSLSECLDECLRQTSFQCRSAMYSERFRSCRLSRFGQREGNRVIYDPDFDYYENLGSIVDNDGPQYRPDPLGQDTNYHGHGRPPYNSIGGGGGYGSGGGYGGHGGGSYGGGGYGGQGGGGGGGGGYGVHSGYGGGGGGVGGAGYGGGGPYGGGPYGGGPAGGGGGGPGPGYGGDGYYGGSPNRPYRCDEAESFRQIGVRLRIRRQFIRRFISVPSLPLCERECAESRDFTCRSFNYRAYAVPYGADRENCELSERDTRDLDIKNPSYFETNGDYDFYERFGERGLGGECLDVSQVCNEDGMEFTLRTPEGFYGRIYTYGFYDRCFFRGNGGTANVLRISGAQGYPDCGTQRYADTMTNIVVVQFSDFVQTGRDKRYNLTCLFRGPGEAVVTSGYIGAGSGSPTPIEVLPAENSISSRVRLLILYQGRPTTTIAVGDPLTFRLEAQDAYNYATDIFATNVVARDPYSGRSVQLIDRYGCPVDNYVFPGLDRSRSGEGLEARFNAFKIPESNFLVFEATVRTCRDGCQPAYCTGHAGRSEPSFGRRKRETNETDIEEDKMEKASNSTDEEEQVREMIEVLESRKEFIQEEKMEPMPLAVCLTTREYYGLVSAIVIILIVLLAVSAIAGTCYRRYWSMHMKNQEADSVAPSTNSYPSRSNNFSFLMSGNQKPFNNRQPNIMPELQDSEGQVICSIINGRTFDDPSEPIYTDPSLFERSRSLRSIAISQAGQHCPKQV